MPATVTARPDKEVTRAIHRLFWRANSQKKAYLALSFATRPIGQLLYNVFIPVAGAYGVQAIVQRDMQAVYHYAIQIAVLAVAYCFLWGVGAWAVHHNGVAGAVYLQKTVFANYLQKDSEFYANNYVGALGAQIGQLRDSYIQYCQLMTTGIPKQFMIVVAGVAVIAWHSWELALVTIAAMVAVLSYTLWSSRWRLKWRRQVSEASADMGGLMGDALSQGTTVKSFATEEYEQGRIDKPASRWSRAQYMSWTTAIPADLGRMVLAAAATAILLILTARLYIDGSISIAIVTLVQLYVVRLVASTVDIAEIIKTYETAMGGAYQPVRTMFVEPTVNDPKQPRTLPSGSLHVSFQGATYHYEGTAASAKAVAGFDLDIAPGEKIGLVGYSGSGKTTLTKLLLRFMDTTGGSIRIGGIDIRDITQHELRRYIAYVPQEPLLFHRSIEENIAYGRPTASAEQVKEAAHRAYVDEFANELPDKYKTLVGERGVKLSGGQRQRVAIARAILKDAPVLVLDEATSALDSRSEKFIQQALWRLMKDRTALVVAHRLSTIQRMDRIVVMDKGKIVQVGTHAELLKDTEGIYARLWEHQSGGYVGLPAKAENSEAAG